MGYRYSRYSIDDLAETSLAKDPDFIDFMIETGKSVAVVYEAPNTDELIWRALNNPDVHPRVIDNIFTYPELNERKRNSQNVALLEEFVQAGSSLRVAAVIAELCNTLDSLAEESPAALKMRIAEVLTACISPNVDQDEVGRSFTVRAAIASQTRNAAYGMRVLVEATAYAVSIANVPGEIKDAIDERTQNGGSFWYTDTWFEDVVAKLVEVFPSKDLFTALESSPMKVLLDLPHYAGTMVVDDGKFAIDYANTHGWTVQFVESAIGTDGDSSKNSPRYREKVMQRRENILRVALGSSEVANPARRKAFQFALQERGDLVVEFVDEFVDVLCTEADEDSDDMEYDLTTTYLIRTARHSPIFPIAEGLMYLDELDTSDASEVLGLLVTSLHGGNEDGSVTAESVVAMWERVDAYIAADPQVHARGANAKVALINTGLVPEDTLRALEQENSVVGSAARRMLGAPELTAIESPAATKRERKTTWDREVNGNTDFSAYLALAEKHGFTPVASLAMYCTDTRIDLNTRRTAREDLMRILAKMPDHARSVPDTVWGNLNRVKDALPISGDLASVLYDLGGSARKLGSKHLIKSVLL